MTYNADGSDFYNLAKNLSKKWEEKLAKALTDMGLQADAPATAAALADSGSKISVEEKRVFARSLYNLTKEDLGKLIVEVDNKCPHALIKNATEDECELNVDKLNSSLFQELKTFVESCTAGSGAPKSKKAKKS